MHKLVASMFTPEPQPFPAPKVFIGAVGEAMTEMCGDVADGMLAHSFTTRRYLWAGEEMAGVRITGACRCSLSREPGSRSEEPFYL